MFTAGSSGLARAQPGWMERAGLPSRGTSGVSCWTRSSCAVRSQALTHLNRADTYIRQLAIQLKLFRHVFDINKLQRD